MRTVLLMTTVLALGASAWAQNTWSPAGANAAGRVSHTFTALADGRGLVAGGKPSLLAGALASSEIYDPAANAWAPAAPMGAARADHSATLLADGRVLVVGGCATGAPCNPPSASAEIFDPTGKHWSPAAALSTARARHTANRLPDGRVIVFGGEGVCNSSVCVTLASTEIYDPASNTWSPGPSMPQPRQRATSTSLADGRVLVAGGCTSSGLPCTVQGAIVYDPVGNSFGTTGPMVLPRAEHEAVRLAGGDVLVVGGVDGGGFQTLRSERFDPATNAWSAAPDSLFTHFGSAMERLPSGDVIIAGGSGGSAPSRLSEVFSVAGNAWIQVGSLAAGRAYPRLARLAGGAMVLTGGADGGANGVASAEQFQQGATPLVALAPAAIDFGYQAVRTTGDVRTLTVRNVGAAPLSIGAVTLAGPNSADFLLGSQCTAPVAPGGSCELQLRFRPSGVKDRSAVLALADNAPNSPHQAGLSGYGYIGALNFWAPAGTMNEARFGHTLTPLPDGRALAIGGGYASPRVEAFAAGAWSYLAPMSTGRSGHTSTVLSDGRILVVGGSVAPSAEIYSVAGNAWSPAGAPATARSGHAAVRLASGKVVVIGGCAAGACKTTEIYDPATDRWAAGPSLAVARSAPSATLLNDGSVLVAGGSVTSKAAEVYDPVANAFTSAGAMRHARNGQSASRLPDGRVIVAGGCDGSYCASTEIFDPATRRWSRAAAMSLPRVAHTAATLADGRVLVAGGLYYCEPEFGFCFSTRAVDVYDPASGRWRPLPPMLEPRADFAATVLHSGQVLVSGGDDDLGEPKATAEILTPAPP